MAETRSIPASEVRHTEQTWGADPRLLPNLRRDTEDGLPSEPSPQATRLARALGWFSIGLGLAEILAPRAMSRIIGVGEDSPRLMPLMGAREMATGVGLLASTDPTPWLWMRVVGDAIDLSLLGKAITEDDSRPGCVQRTMAAVAGVAALDVLSAIQHSASE